MAKVGPPNKVGKKRPKKYPIQLAKELVCTKIASFSYNNAHNCLQIFNKMIKLAK